MRINPGMRTFINSKMRDRDTDPAMLSRLEVATVDGADGMIMKQGNGQFSMRRLGLLAEVASSPNLSNIKFEMHITFTALHYDQFT